MKSCKNEPTQKREKRKRKMCALEAPREREELRPLREGVARGCSRRASSEGDARASAEARNAFREALFARRDRESFPSACAFRKGGDVERGRRESER